KPGARPGSLSLRGLWQSLGRVIHAIGMMQGGGDLVLAEAGAIVAVDQQGHAAAAVDMARPTECLVERGKLLEQELVFLERRDRFRAARTDINAIAHEVPPLKAQREPK